MATVSMVFGYSTGQQATLKFENHLDDVVFNDKLLFEQTARSKVICAQLCANSNLSLDCVTFTYLSRSKTCRGHAVVMTQSSAKTSAPGAQSYKQFGAGMYQYMHY
jgi:hypothetical protein